MSQIKTYLQTHTNPPVFLISGGVVIVLVALASVFPGQFSSAASAIQSFIFDYFSWLFVFSTTFFVGFVIYIALSKYGNLRLGEDDSTPEFDTWSWVSMMFTAGMGIGLVYYAVSEPLTHYKNPPVVDGSTPAAAASAMNYTFFHWGFQPWAIYIVLGLSLGYFAYRRGLPLKPAAAFYPFIGDRINGPIGHCIDILAVFGTLFGLATSIGIGASQIAAGLGQLFSFSDGLTTQLLVILAVEIVAITSVMLGVDAGIRRLSVINMWLAIGLAAFVFIVGPTLYILSNLATDTGYYLQHFIGTSLTIFTNPKGEKFQHAWTIFYWSWWISWSPFVGMFIARISYGYTIRQFILGTLLIPTGASIVWFVIFGRTALDYVTHGIGADALMNANSANAIFVLMDQLPVGTIISFIASAIAIIVVTLFFATSSDSGSLVVDILTNGGDPNPIWQQRLFWAIMEGAIAAVLLVAGTVSGGDSLSALQTAAVTSGLPFCIVLLVMCAALYKALSEEKMPGTRINTDTPAYGAQRSSK
ncbi:MAG: BCCT family transporter [Salinisphaera sp.]|jgi:choline/glycine/proline betaine transport protein|nr:BCCT family transporter [Salinisphaera sp.]